MASRPVPMQLDRMIPCPIVSPLQVPLVTHPLAKRKVMACQNIVGSI
jgi:hypothetical protein